MEPLLSIVIPTRNRQQYCIAVIKDILSHNFARMELCVQDNSDDDQIEQFISDNINDSRLVYKRITPQIASAFNIGTSLGLATGKYVMMIGDDDTILPSIFEVVKFMDENNIDSMCPTPIIDYYWPNAHQSFPEGYLIIPTQKYVYNEINDVNQRQKTLFRKGITDYLLYNLPKVYHGIVRRSILEQIKAKTGHYVGGLSPDIYLCTAISALVRNHYTCGFSVSIAGACAKSTTSQSVNKGHVGHLSEAPHLNLRGDYKWDERVPEYYSVETIWAETALKSASEMGLSDLDKCYNFNYLAALALYRHRDIFKFMFNQTFGKYQGVQYYWKIAKVIPSAIKIFCQLCSRKIVYLLSKTKRQEISPVKDIVDAVSFVNELQGTGVQNISYEIGR